MGKQNNNADGLPVYDTSESLVRMKVNACKHTDEQLKNMGIDRRWEADNRTATWNFGMVNFGFDQNFLHKGGMIDDTDDRVQPIWDSDALEITGYRRIVYNGSWMKINKENN